MSSFSSWSGRVTFKNQKDFDKVIGILTPVLNPLAINMSSPFTVKFPDVITANNGTKNLHLRINQILEIPHEGTLIGTSTDGEYSGWVYVNGKSEENVNLETYAEKIGLPLNEFDEDEESDEFFNRLADVEEKWVDEMESKYLVK